MRSSCGCIRNSPVCSEFRTSARTFPRRKTSWKCMRWMLPAQRLGTHVSHRGENIAPSYESQSNFQAQHQLLQTLQGADYWRYGRPTRHTYGTGSAALSCKLMSMVWALPWNGLSGVCFVISLCSQKKNNHLDNSLGRFTEYPTEKQF